MTTVADWWFFIAHFYLGCLFLHTTAVVSISTTSLFVFVLISVYFVGNWTHQGDSVRAVPSRSTSHENSKSSIIQAYYVLSAIQILGLVVRLQVRIMTALQGKRKINNVLRSARKKYFNVIMLKGATAIFVRLPNTLPPYL
jgi:hypothetical protein